MRLRALAIGAVCVLLGLLTTDGNARRFAESAKSRLLMPPPATTLAPGQENYDAERYLLDIEIDFDAEEIIGSVILFGRAGIDGFQEVVLDLHHAMTVTGVSSGSTPLVYTHQDTLLIVTLDHAYDTSQPWFVTVDYHGHPANGNFPFFAFEFGTHDGHPIASSLSQPIYAKNWWPCKDVIDDKAFVWTSVTVPDTMFAVSNGRLVGIEPSPGKLTFNWQAFAPLSTYLVGVTATNYVTWQEDYVSSAQQTMPVHYFAYPERLSAAQEDWSITLEVMHAFAAAFGEEYPFLDDKYAMAMFEWAGGMEHQTCTSYGSNLVTGDHAHDVELVHELSHSWWGNLVTPLEWNDIWLAEGFATWCEALWQELSIDQAAYHAHLRSLDTGVFPGPLHAPDYLFSRTVYKKGAWVVHMLRHVMGDEAFFQLLQSYASTFAYNNASTADLAALASAAHGESLDWFFDEWVYDEGRPGYEYGWSKVFGEGVWEVTVTIDQTHTVGPIFQMPIDIGLVMAGGDTLWTTIVNNTQHAVYELETVEEPVSFLLDPFNWILKWSAPTGVEETAGSPAVHLALGPARPNPIRAGGATIEYALPASGTVRLSIYNAAGRLITTLDDGWQPAGEHRLFWNGRLGSGQRAAGGIYFLRLDAAGRAATQRIVVIH